MNFLYNAIDKMAMRRCLTLKPKVKVINTINSEVNMMLKYIELHLTFSTVKFSIMKCLESLL